MVNKLKLQRKKLCIFMIGLLFFSVFLAIAKPQSVKAQPVSLFSDDFDINQPNLQFSLGSNDTITSASFFSPSHSLQVSSATVSPFSNATFDNVTGQIYVKINYKTNNTGYSNILQLKGETAYIGVYQDLNGIIFDWDYGYNETNILLSPNVWNNITLSLYLDPNQGSNSSATLWLNSSIIASQGMPQVNGYSINTLVFDTTRVWRAATWYDDIFVGTQSSISPSPTPDPTATPTPTATPSPTLSPTPTPAPTSTLAPIQTSNPTATPTQKPTSDPTSSPTSSATPFSSPTIPEISFILLISIFAAITGFFLVMKKRKRLNNAFQTIAKSFPKKYQITND